MFLEKTENMLSAEGVKRQGSLISQAKGQSE